VVYLFPLLHESFLACFDKERHAYQLFILLHPGICHLNASSSARHLSYHQR
jgi:hypothetical protein